MIIIIKIKDFLNNISYIKSFKYNMKAFSFKLKEYP